MPAALFRGHGGVMVLELSATLQGRLTRWAQAGYPRECCGLLLGRVNDGVVHVDDVLQARNANAERAGDRYELDAQDFLRADAQARARQLDVVGVWHTHPDHPARPSATDRAHAWDGWSYLILAVGAQGVDALRSWRLDGEEFVEEAVRP
ncbi:M67 family metallopeptidase [Piscinibacter sp.]|uniref:M67 family metallopeptidase n=1 Tax=Piscinibacter sp. TaxID=1903157 RepID=UPI002F4186F7